MKIIKVILYTILLFETFFLDLTLAAQSPQQCVEVLLETIKKIKREKGINHVQGDTNKQLSTKALHLINLEAVSRKALGKYWDKRSSIEQKGFVILLSGLLEKIAFPSSARFFEKLDIQYKKSEVTGNHATVPILVQHDKEGEVEINFVMHRINVQWLVVDVVLDGVSMRNNLRSKFYKVIVKNNYTELVRRMNKKLQASK